MNSVSYPLKMVSQRRNAFQNYVKPESLKNTKLRRVLIPSATKLRRLCFYRCVSVHRGGCLVRGVCLVLGGSAPGGGSALAGAWSRGVGIPACTEADPPRRDGYCCGRYASYWNAFLFLMNVFSPQISKCL